MLPLKKWRTSLKYEFICDGDKQIATSSSVNKMWYLIASSALSNCLKYWAPRADIPRESSLYPVPVIWSEPVVPPTQIKVTRYCIPNCLFSVSNHFPTSLALPAFSSSSYSPSLLALTGRDGSNQCVCISVNFSSLPPKTIFVTCSLSTMDNKNPAWCSSWTSIAWYWTAGCL